MSKNMETLINLSGIFKLTVRMCSIRGRDEGNASATSMSARELIDSSWGLNEESGTIIFLLRSGLGEERRASEDSGTS